MIELPPHSRPELKPTATASAGSTADGASASVQSRVAATATAASGVNAASPQPQVKQNVEAVVIQTTLIEQAGSAQKTVYEMLLRVSGQNTAAAQATPLPANTPPITQITPQVLAALQQGQTLMLKVVADFLLAPSTRLLASASIEQGLQIQKPDTAGLINTHSSAFRQLIPLQRSLTPLMASLELIAKPETGNRASQSLPTAVHSALQELSALLPRVSQIRQPGYLQQSIRHNGTFLESNLNRVISQQLAKAAGSDGLMDSLRKLSQRLLDSASTTSSKPTATADGQSTAEISLKSALAHISGADFKVALQRLQQALQQSSAASANASRDQAGSGGEPPSQNNPGAKAEASKQLLSRLNPSENKLADKTNPILPSNAKITEATRPHPALRHYSPSVTTPQPTASTTPPSQEQYLLPPLPGQVLIQPQARQNLSQNKNDLAQALVSVLLKQVHGALARTTLHQLASHTQQTESTASPMLLSFELPFLHNQQIQVFQFRIEQDSGAENSEDKQYQKRWVVQMGFDIEGMGPMLCQINLAGINASVSFWAEWENTLQHTRSHFDFLEKTLTEMGLRVDKLQGHLGIPANERTLLSNQLVDIRL